MTACAAEAPAPSPPPSETPAGVTVYEAAYFADDRPSSAYDMITRLPGFTFDGGSSVRGFAGAAGNVLVDGQRPATKTDSLHDLLARIPASSVLRVELIRGGAPGIDMEGRTVLANVVRRRDATTELALIAIGEVLSEDRRARGGLRFDGARRNGTESISGSIFVYRDANDDNGLGQRITRGPDGALVSSARVRVQIPVKAISLRGGLQHEVLGGVLQLNAAYDGTWLRNLEDDTAIAAGAGPPASVFVTDDVQRSGELSANYARKLASTLDLKIVALQTVREEPVDSTALQGSDFTDFSNRSRAAESILRAVVTYRRSEDFSLEAGGEGAYNRLAASSRLAQNGLEIPVPGADVLVEESRAEGFVTATWRASSRLNLEFGGRLEASRISQTGDHQKSESFVFPKPRILAAWSFDANDQLRLRLEREVGQLDFTNFAASANLANGALNAGAANLQPQRDWLYEAVFEHRYGNKGSVSLALSHADLEEVIDVVPVGDLNAPGNIGTGRRDMAELSLTAPLARLGMAGGQLVVDAKWRFSRVIDPTTHRSRAISGDRPFEGTFNLTNEVPALKSTWAVNVTSGYRQTNFRIDEIDQTRYRTWVDLTWNYKPSNAWSAQLRYEYLPGHRMELLRTVFGGPRDTHGVVLSDALSLRQGPWWRLEVRRTW